MRQQIQHIVMTVSAYKEFALLQMVLFKTTEKK